MVADLRAEQALGRVVAALLLLGACERLVLVELMTGPDTLPFRDRPDPAPELVATLLAGLDPGPGRQPSAPTDTETRP